jgi:hypothetical protein
MRTGHKTKSVLKETELRYQLHVSTIVVTVIVTTAVVMITIIIVARRLKAGIVEPEMSIPRYRTGSHLPAGNWYICKNRGILKGATQVMRPVRPGTKN